MTHLRPDLRRNPKTLFSERLLSSMRSANLNIAELADQMGYQDPSTISHWLRSYNRPPLDKFELLCSILGVSPNYLLGWSDDVQGVSLAPTISDLERALRQLKRLARPPVVRSLKEASRGK